MKNHFRHIFLLLALCLTVGTGAREISTLNFGWTFESQDGTIKEVIFRSDREAGDVKLKVTAKGFKPLIIKLKTTY